MHEQIIQKIKDAGVVGAGGAGFPTHVKVASQAQSVIVNGAECEPLLRVDQQLMEVKADKMIQGLMAVMKATGATEGIVALKGKYKRAIASLEKAVIGKPIRINILGDFYPAGDEHVTVYESTGRLVPQGGIPLKVDCVVNNVETLLNIADAIEGKPVTDTYLTITGEVPQPLTLKLPIGTSVLEALRIVGQTNLEGMKVIEGGPMMGKVIEDLNQPITKTTKGLIVLSLKHPLIQKRLLPLEKMAKQAQVSCIQCRYCTDLCPRYLLGHHLEPHKIMRTIKHLQGQEETLKMALACTECGVCEQYACIMGLSPRSVNSMIKRELFKMGIKPDVPPANQAVNAMQAHRKVPVKRLVSRLGLKNFDVSAPLSEEEYLVNRVRIKLHQHVGAPSQSIVQVGQQVQKGDLIAVTPDKALGANIHASISGVIQEITDSIVISSMEGSDK